MLAEKFQVELRDIANICELRDIRLTKKRQVVLKAMLTTKNALSAYEIADICRQQFDLSFPPMSVYRILDFFQSSGIVHRLLLANKFILCDHFCCYHEHQLSQFLICSKCHSVTEVDLPQSLATALENSVDKAGYKMITPQLEIQCICNACAEK